QLLFHVADLLDFVQEPAVDSIGSLRYRAHGDTGHQSVLDPEDPIPLRSLDIFQQLFGVHETLSVITQTYRIILQALTGLLYGLSKTSSNGHYLADAFHLQAKRIVGALELIEIPARYLDDNIVLYGLEISGGSAGDLVLQLIQRIPDGQFGGDLGDRITRRLRREGRAPADTGVDLDGDDLFRLRIQGELYVTTTGEITQIPHHHDGGIAHQLKSGVAERHCRRYGDRVSRMDAHRIEIFDRADDDDVIVRIAQ